MTTENFEIDRIENEMDLSRRKLLRLSAASALCLSAPGLLLPRDALAAKAGNKTISYGPQKMDIYPAQSKALANSQGQTPVVAFVHGGAWRLGNRGQVGSKPRWFTKRGYTFVSIGYTLYPFVTVGQQAKQVATATRYIQENIAQYGGDPSRVALMGHSAGCHLACLATLSGQTSGVRALVANDTGAYDLQYLASLNGNHLPALYSRPFHDRAQWTQWSPASHVGSRKQPPTLVAWSNGHNRDKISKNFISKFHQSGQGVNTFDGSGKYNHLSINSTVGRRNDGLTSAIDNFLDVILT